MTEPRHRRTAILLVGLLSVCLCVTGLNAQTVLVGDQTIESNLDSNATGLAEAFPATATASGQVGSINFFLDESSAATKIYVGIYNDASGKPGSLLTQGSTTQFALGTWNSVTVSAVSLISGTAYWIAILGTTGGKPYFHDRSTTNCHSQTSSQSNLTSLPSTWSTGKTWNTCYISAYAVAGTLPATVMIGNQEVESNLDKNPAEQAEAFPAIANTTGSVAVIDLYLDPTSGSGPVYIGLYADNGKDHPGTLLGQGSTASPVAGSWNSISITPSSITAGSRYWIALLGTQATSPYFRDRQTTACHSETSSQTNLASLPSTWSTGASWNTCYISAYGLPATGSPILSISPSSLSFAAIQGGANPVPANLSVTNTGSGTLSFTAYTDQSWLSATPASGTAPQTVQVSAAVGSLTAGTYTGHVTVTAAGAQDSPAVATVTFTVSPFVPPSITALASPPANANGWNNTNVTVTFTCTAGSYLIQTCTAPIVVSTQGANQIVIGTVTDTAGNSNAIQVTLNISTTPPTITATPDVPPNSVGWNDTSVTVTYNCTATIAPINICPAPQVVATQGTNQNVTATASDLAGNTASAGLTLNLDLTKPTIQGTATPPPGPNGINTTPVTITYQCSDALSGIAVCPPAVTVSASGANQIIKGDAVDVAGNTASSLFTLNIELIPLTISASASPPANSAGWNNSNVTITYVCGGGVAPISCPTPLAVTQEAHGLSVYGTASDAAGNLQQAGVSLSVDKTPPVLTIVSPANGTNTGVSQATIQGLVSDALSGVMSVTCNGSPATITGTAFSCNVTLSIGTNNIAVNATDVAGNNTSSSVTLVYAKPINVQITSPTTLQLFSSNPVTVTGTVSDPTATVTVGGVTATLNGTTFTAHGVVLREGNNLLTASATTSAGGVGSDSVSAYLDTTPPTVRIGSPASGAVVTSSQIDVTGDVNDMVTGTVNGDQVSVVVNGVNATVANRSFAAHGVLLVPGQNTITALATDRAGNTNQHQVQVILQQLGGQTLSVVSGNDQSAPINTVLPQPLVVLATDALGRPMVNVALNFSVAQSDGLILAGQQSGRQLTVQTGVNGQASVQFRVGSRNGAGANQVAVAAPGFVGQTVFSADSTVGTPTRINIVSGDMQVGAVGVALAQPLVAIVTDAGGNPVANVAVTFTVQSGGGLIGAGNTFVQNTDGDGRAYAVLVLGQQEGINNNDVVASFPGMTGQPAAFLSSGVVPGPVANTIVSGVVLDNAEQPIPNTTASIENTNLSALTNAQGQFTIVNAPVGDIILFIDGSTSTSSYTFPTLSFQMATIPGINNTLGRPIYLPALDTSNSQVVGGAQAVQLTLTGVPGLVYTVAPNSVTFPDGTHVGPLTISQVHNDRVPMIPVNGTAPRLVLTVQPAGVLFNPPVQMQFPNTDGLAPGQVINIFSFHHDLEQFVVEGTARVSEDGSVVVSDPGFGLTISGWDGGGPTIPQTTTCGDGCNNGNTCQSGSCANGACQFTTLPDGTSCTDPSGCTVNDVCTGGACGGDQIDINDVEIQANSQEDEAFVAMTTSNGASAPVSVNFTSQVDQDNCPSLNYSWNFGDGGTSTDANPAHPYTAPGTYKVTLNVNCNPPCNTAIAQPAEVDVTVLAASVNSADVTQDQIAVSLMPGGQTGTLRMQLLGANNRQLSPDQPNASGNSTQSFYIDDLGVLTNDNGDDYTQVSATWMVASPSGSTIQVVGTFDYHILVLGSYRHSVYNTPTESQCSGAAGNAYILAGPAPVCFNNYTQDTLISQFISQVDINGSGVATQWGDVKSLAATSCSGATKNRPAGATGGANGNSFVEVDTITGTCNTTLGNTTVASCAKDTRLSCGNSVFINTVGVKTVQDTCPACCKDANYQHLDNYTTQQACNPRAFNDLGNFVTIKLF
jgi:hypothetical protein